MGSLVHALSTEQSAVASRRQHLMFLNVSTFDVFEAFQHLMFPNISRSSMRAIA
jgi:hypothetical protein